MHSEIPVIKYIGVAARKFWGCKGSFARISPKKGIWDKLSPCKFSAVGTFYCPLKCCHKIENLAFEIWFFITQLNKSTPGCARTLSQDR